MESNRSNGKAGRTGYYTADIPERAYRLCLLGLTDAHLATAFGVNIKTIEYWKRHKDEFRESVLAGRMEADAHVAEALYKKAIGYSHPDTHITTAFNRQTQKTEVIITPIVRHYAPDSWAALKWLGLRQKQFWNDVQKVEVSGGLDITHLQEQLSDETQYSTGELEMALQLGLKNAIAETDVNQN